MFGKQRQPRTGGAGAGVLTSEMSIAQAADAIGSDLQCQTVEDIPRFLDGIWSIQGFIPADRPQLSRRTAVQRLEHQARIAEVGFSPAAQNGVNRKLELADD